MAVGHFGVVTGGALTNIIVYDPSTPALTLPAGEVLTTALDTLSPMPQIGWSASEVGGVWTFAPPVVTAPAFTLAQQAQAALAGNVTIVSSGTPAISGTYAIDQASQLQINSVWNYVIKFGVFPGGGTSYAWADAAGASHTFPTVAAFEAWAAAICTYIAALTQIALSLSTAALPPNPVDIG